MGQTLSDFSALKGLKKEMEKQEQAASPKPVIEQKKARTVQHRTLEEEHARNIGIEKGAKVRMMDTSDTGTIVGIGKGFYEIELDGLVIRAVKSEFILIDEAEDRKMYASMPSSPKKHVEKRRQANPTEELVVDLHLERIPGNASVPEWAALEYQMNWFRKILRENLKYRGKRIIFIHGDGDGTLKTAVRKELGEVFALSCSYTYGASEQYGTGATVVTVR